MTTKDQRYSNQVLSYYNDKSIVHAYNFLVHGHVLDKYYILPYQVIDVDIPFYKFQRVSMSYGATPYSFPVLSQEQPIDIRLTLEESRYRNVATMIQQEQTNIVCGGVHNNPYDARGGDDPWDIYIELYNDKKEMICRWSFKPVFFLGAENVSMVYDSNETVKYVVTFGADRIIYNGFSGSFDVPSSSTVDFRSAKDASNYANDVSRTKVKTSFLGF
jgi:hypothetical protein